MKKLILVLLILVIAFYIKMYLMEKSVLDGGIICKYKKFTDKVKTDSIQFENDSIYFIRLKSIIDTNEHYQIDEYENENVIDKRFDKNEIRNKLKIFIISGDKITNGNCAPYIIKEMKIDK